MNFHKGLRFGLAVFFIFSVYIALQAQKSLPFEKEIKAFEAEDRATPPPKNALLFTGSSSIRLWGTIRESFPDKAVLPRGFGGSQLSDVIRYANRIIIPYRPRQVIIYAGENDIATKQTGRQVYERFRTLFTLIRKQLPQTAIVFISMKPSPSRRPYFSEIQEGNRLIKEYLATQRGATYVDVYSAMLDANGRPKGELFKSDSLHMTEKGYAIWTEKLRPVLK